MNKRLGVAIFLTLLSSGLFFLFNFILARLLGANKFGEIQYYISFIQLISLTFSLNYASLYMGNKILEENKNALSLFISAQSSLFILLLIPIIIILNKLITSNIVILCLICSSYLFVIMTSISLEYNSKKKISLSILSGSLIHRILLIFFFSLMIWFGYNLPQHYLYAYFASIIAVVGYSISQLKPRIHPKLPFIPRAWKFYLLGLTGSSFAYIAQILQKELYGFSQLAVLSISLLILTGLGIWGSLLIKIILPVAHDYWRRKDLTGISKIYRNNTYLELITILPLYFLILFNIERISSALGAGYEDLPYIFLILSIGYLFNLITGITGTLLRVTGHESFELFNELTRLIIGLALIYLLKHHDYGIAIAISVATTVYNLLKFFEIFYLFKIWPLTKAYFFHTFILVVASALLLFSSSKVENTYIFFITTIMSLALVYSYSYHLVSTNPQLLKALKIK